MSIIQSDLQFIYHKKKTYLPPPNPRGRDPSKRIHHRKNHNDKKKKKEEEEEEESISTYSTPFVKSVRLNIIKDEIVDERDRKQTTFKKVLINNYNYYHYYYHPPNCYLE